MRSIGHYDWLKRLTPLLAAIMIAIVISIFRGYWWQDTFKVIYLLLALVSTLQMIWSSRVPRFIMHALEVIGIVMITFIVNAHRAQPISENLTGLERIWHHLANLHPIIEIALVIYATHLIFTAWVISRKRLLIFFAIALLILCVKDSFSPHKLWWQIALVVVLFLIWHAILHFYELDQKSPTSFRVLLERPFTLVAPIIFMICLLLIVGTSLPAGPPILKDPYTLWKQSRGENVNIGNNGTTHTNNRVQLSPLTNKASGYSRADAVLGGGFNFDYSPVMTVKTTHKSYWRGESRYYYDGQGWNNEDYTLGTDSDSVIIRINDDLLAEERPLAETITVEQEVTLLRQIPLPVLFGAGQLSHLSSITYKDNDDQANNRLDTPPAGELVKGSIWMPLDWRIQQYGDGTESSNIQSYSVQSEVIVIDHDALKAASAFIDDERAMSAYTSLPEKFPERVRNLAEEVTAAGENDYEKVLLLEQHLKSNYSYTNQPDTSKLTGASSDFVEQFLFELKEGYCDYYSTSMVMMARTLNIPARWVKGFSSGVSNKTTSFNPSQVEYWESSENKDTSGTYTVRNADAHSWVEIYFEGYGWIAFEPTPGFSFPYTYANDKANPLQELLHITPTLPLVTKEIAVSNSSTNAVFSWLIWMLLIIIAIGSIMMGIKHRDLLRAAYKKIRYRSYSINETIVVEMKHFLTFCSKKGLEYEHHATLRETIKGWNFGSATWRSELQILLQYYERAHYSKEQLNDYDLTQVQNLVTSLKKNWYS